ncbi:amidohydrolase family protein [Alteromonas lipolytica]|uniref:Amidohydrolase-related domain-containing protein n=1 Tax=Alteromonas lipolytica TaxID=1856405 RepID=A0A1E8FC50_9ALTE|nr:amidohydrolase family protein [Alteromonas lipolytica]OFI33366.1 hypothetical protein BFC17_03640 [Alteromonas lipolytica]GGF60353.1 hypothetical protein GCM10011338_10740 [Alteromonas lipolytica]
MRFSLIIIVCLALISAFISLLPTPEVTPQQGSVTSATTQLPESGSYRLTNVTVFDGESWHENTELSIHEGRIISPGSLSQEETLLVVDGKGGYVIPGLIDTHTHSWNNALQQSLQYGVTTTLDMFTDSRFFLSKKQQRNTLSPQQEADLFSAGVLVTSKGGHGTEYGIPIPTIATPQEAPEFVAARLAEGSDYIKIVYDASASHADHKGRFTSIDYETLQAVVTAAHEQRVLAVVHVMDLTSAEDAAKAGADGLVHTFGGKIASDELIKLMQEQHIFVIPTLSILASIAGEGRGQALIENSPFSEFMAPGAKHAIATDVAAKRLPENYFANAQENTRLMHKAGIRILAGTDAPNQGTTHGISLHDELVMLVDSGLTPTEALQAATYLPYAIFPIGERGHLKVGARADYLVLNSDPREDIRHTQQIRWVVKNGSKVPAFFELRKTSAATSESGLVSQFDSGLTPQLGNQFVVSTDQMMRGNSTATIEHIAKGCHNNGALRVQGTIGKQFPYPWSGTFLMFSDSIDTGYNLSNFKRIVFDIQGTQGQFRLMVLNPQTMQPSEVSFAVDKQCKQVSIALKDITGVDWQNVSGIGWVAGATTPEFEFELDNIYFE